MLCVSAFAPSPPSQIFDTLEAQDAKLIRNYLSFANTGQRGPRTNAREKLTRLSQQQFTELSTDVYDELMRRINNARTGAEMPHLAVREEFHPKRNQARQKLATLPKTRFKDLSSDVFFELERRFPYLRDEYRPEVSERERREEEDAIKRQEMSRRPANDARRNSALSSTMGQEELTGEEPAPLPQRSMTGPSAASKTDIVIPAKSTLVEEEIAVPYAQSTARDTKDWRASASGDDINAQSNRDSIMTSTDGDQFRSTMYSQASSVGTGFYNGYANSRATESVASPHIATGEGFAGSAFGEEKMRSDYEFRIATLQHKVTSLEAKVADDEKVKGEQIKELEKQLQEQQGTHGTALSSLTRQVEQHRDEHEQTRNQFTQTLAKLNQLQGKHDALIQEQSERSATASDNNSRALEDLAALQKDYSEQEEVVTELRGEVTNLVEELRQLSLRNDEILADKDNDEAIIRDLNSQVSSYKRKYENAKTELRNLKATSQLFVQAPKADDFMPASDEGIIADVSLTAFQSSIDQLVAAARSKAPSNVLLAMKTVVLATTLITDDVSKYELRDGATGEVREQVVVIKGRIANTLNNLMTACRNHASSYGMSPVSLLDAAASHVSTSIVDMVKLLKVRKATKAEAEEFEATFTQNGTLPNGLKPLHTNVLNSSHITTAPFSPASSEFRRQTSVGKGDVQENRLGPNSSLTGEGRYSPRARVGPTMGRYSPVTYRSDIPRKSSNGSWKASEDDRARKTSESSHTSSKTPAVPVIDGSILKLARSVSTNSSASPHLHAAESSYDSTTKTNSTLASLRASIIPPPSITALGDDSTEENWAELRNYIEVQTEAIVHSIQALLSSIREGAQGNQLNENLTQITTIVSSIIAISKDNIPKATAHSSSPTADLDGEKILQELSENCEKLIEMQMVGKFDKLTKSNMASASYGVAKGLKALSGLLNSDEQ
jgi:hypothetical protein